MRRDKDRGPRRGAVDLSPIDEMARRLRSAKLYDNRLADRVVMMVDQIEHVEEALQVGASYTFPPKPCESWKDAKLRLVHISSSRWQTFTEIPAPVATCLAAAVLFFRLEMAGHRWPDDVRTMDHGALYAEWPDGKGIILDGAGIEPIGKWTELERVEPGVADLVGRLQQLAIESARDIGDGGYLKHVEDEANQLTGQLLLLVCNRGRGKGQDSPPGKRT